MLITPFVPGRFIRVAHAAMVAGTCGLVVGCGTYEPPKPGVHREVGQPRADLTCEYAQPTAMVIKAWRCRDTANMPEEERRAKEALERIDLPPPRIP